jgi:hypothetical protein
MRAPQFGKVRDRMPEGPNPAAKLGLRVSPFANIFALVEGLGVISLHQKEADAKAALEGEIERRLRFNASHVVSHKDAVEAEHSEQSGGGE